MLVPSIFRDNFVDDVFNDMFSMPFGFERGTYSPNLLNTDVQEFDDKYQLDVELPGYNKEDIHAELKDGYLTINASHNENKDEKDSDGKYIRKERYMGQCRRSFYVGNQITQEDIHAKFENGVLNLEIPKNKVVPEVDEKKYIAIKG